METKYGTKYFSAKEIDNFRKQAYKEFYISRFIRYLNPMNVYYLSKKIGNYEGLKHTIKMFKTVMSLGYYKK